jgi:DNA-binding transcriptional regulator YhcF (GntR family)
MLKILQTGSAGDLKAKIEFIITLKQVEQTLLKVSWKKMTAELAAKQISKGAALASMRQFAKSIGIQLTKRKALQMIPIIGALIGGSFDGIYIHDVCETAYMSYRRRFIEQWQNQNNI